MSRAEDMRELFARWEKSGRSLRAFGSSEGVGYAKLLYWRRKFRVESAEEASRSQEWTELRVVSDASAPALTEKFEVWLANGIGLDVPPGFDADELRRLVGVLGTC